MKYIVFILVSISLLGCKKNSDCLIPSKEEELSELIIKDSTFKKIFEKSIKEIEFDLVDEDVNQYIIDFYVDYENRSNLILAIRNCPPTTIIDLVYLKQYHGKKVYVYYNNSSKIKKTVSKLIDLTDKPIKSVTLETQPSEFECIYLREFIVSNDSLIPF
ncbi:hypothetical protein LNQ81_13265 [Myroides sp. M-43]|uniref:hypothetical protein n=1 Tax=Myroides oncorhynchi TaxID=2893756 RepID=UPI001E35AEC2|nr:hypothetical protein [Myroides oncorhynchi]MCC9043642.1 hypothetical protein [Myroides oncorhynchi]